MRRMHLERPAGVGGDLEPGLAALQLQLAMLPINAHMHFAARRQQDMRTVRQRFVADFASGGAQHLRGRRRGRAAIQSKRAQQQRRNTGFTQVAAAPALLLALKAGGGGTGLPQLLQVLVLQGMARVGLAPLVERVLIAFAGDQGAQQMAMRGVTADAELAPDLGQGHLLDTGEQEYLARARWQRGDDRIEMPQLFGVEQALVR
ncbi:hypothetical protein G6F50_014937 [Rhizopus delemar]|uniref:Uncharacterized protein n=1 Tax=Rhizopus delemar TaxID=936053 RepID=A0A9P6Y1C2_9FUNG|nr:hypothetical protein G6F50_014937 [Rhizopus delemar]